MRSLLLLTALSLPALAQIELKESLPPGTCVKHELTLRFDGKMKLDRGGKIETAPMEGTGQHVYFERVENESKSFRHYLEAKSSTKVGYEGGERALPSDRRLIVVERGKDGVTHCGAGPMTREEHSLVAEHFDALRIPGLLPEKTVSVNDTWPLRDEVVSGLCLFDGLLKNALTGKLVTLNDKQALLEIAGTAEGIENGAKVKLTVAASGVFDLESKRVTTLTWEQTDDREQGPISPAIEAKVKVTVVRTVLKDEPGELAAKARETLEPQGTKFTKWTSLAYRHPENKYSLIHDAHWHTVVQTETHLVLRYVERGELIAQATITPWKSVATGQTHEQVVKEFLDATAKQQGWVSAKTLASGPVPTDANRNITRLVCRGQQDGVEVVQAFYLVTDVSKAQVIVTCVVKPELLDKLGAKDVALANAIAFPAGK